MTIKKIKIENIKGISSKEFHLDILPNRPSLLVAPNGFGKSSFATAFQSLQTNKVSVHEDNHHRNNSELSSKLIIDYQDSDNSTHTIEANDTSNSINAHFSYFVINNKIKAKGIGRNFGGRSVVSASIAVEPVVLVDTIPAKENFGYSYRNQKAIFGANSKVLSNITNIFNDHAFIRDIGRKYSCLDKLSQVRIQRCIGSFIDSVNAVTGNADALRQWVLDNKIGELEAIAPLNDLSQLILNSNLGINSAEISFLAAIQIHKLYENDRQKFKKAQKYSDYKLDKAEYSRMLDAFNTSWRTFAPSEKGNKLVVEFPKANQISNGQRDVITFVALLYRAQKKLVRKNCILVIDEVFDYLDDANLVAVQYYITKFIDEFKANGKRIYPLILTHLNPYYFKNFAFSKQKVYYLDKRDIQPNSAMVKLLRKREHEDIKTDVSKYLLHYHPTNIDKREEFRNLDLRETWGEGNHFDQFIFEEARKYLEDGEGFDPLSVCCAVRKKVEECVFIQLIDVNHQQAFIDKNKTRSKLQYAEEIGASFPEYFYLLGVIYNDGMHWKEGQDNISPIATKLENQTIKGLINQIING